MSRHISIALLFLFPALLFGQAKEYTLNGYVHIKDGETCTYKISFSVSGTAVKGYSITTDREGQQLQATILGSIDRKRHTLSFVESDIRLHLPRETCLFHAKLAYRQAGAHYLLTGDFTGKDAKSHYCGEGTIAFEPTTKPAYLFEQEKPKKERLDKPVADTGKVVAPPEFTKVKSGGEQQLAWKADTCILEIWDGQVVDGDMVTILLNKQKILEHYTLTSEKKRISLLLRGKTNVITIVAENEGQAPPNTSQVMITDGKLQYGYLVCLEMGKSADIVLKK
jgi:hypothetical protein